MIEGESESDFVYYAFIPTHGLNIFLEAPDPEILEQRIRDALELPRKSYPGFDFDRTIRRFRGYPYNQVPQPGISLRET